jgi:hypothetical protein
MQGLLEHLDLFDGALSQQALTRGSHQSFLT